MFSWKSCRKTNGERFAAASKSVWGIVLTWIVNPQCHFPKLFLILVTVFHHLTSWSLSHFGVLWVDCCGSALAVFDHVLGVHIPLFPMIFCLVLCALSGILHLLYSCKPHHLATSAALFDIGFYLLGRCNTWMSYYYRPSYTGSIFVENYLPCNKCAVPLEGHQKFLGGGGSWKLKFNKH